MVSVGAGKSHTEHIKPQSSFSNLSLEYNNIVASCENGDTCGRRKKNWYGSDFVSPTDDNCEDFFTYSVSGEIKSARKKGVNTIAVLNLNSYRLLAARKAAIGQFAQILVGGYDNVDIEWLYKYLTEPNNEGRLPSFCNAVSYVFNDALA
jgi:hypothetical protein